eukprot:46159_1
MATDDWEEKQYDLEVVLSSDKESLVLNVRDKKNLRKFTNSYHPSTLTAKAISQSLDKLAKILKTASKRNNGNWCLQYGYFTNPTKSSKKKDDSMASYLSKSNIAMLRDKPKPRGDTLFIILQINEDFFSIDTQFKLYEVVRPRSNSKKSRRSASGILRIGQSITSLDDNTTQKMADMKAEISSLKRDNKVLKRKIEKLESTSGKKQKKMDNEREMRLQANKERFWLKQKLERIQKAMEARLKLLGVDFSKVEDITSALDMAFSAIQKLAKELQTKEEAFEDVKVKMNKAVKESTEYRKNTSKLDATIQKQKRVIQDLKKQLGDKDKRLSIVSHEKSDTETALTGQLAGVHGELEQLRNDKERIFDELVDSKAKFKGDMEDKANELEEVKNKLTKSKQDNETICNENEQMKEEADALLNTNTDLNAKLQEALKEIEDLKNELELEKNKNVDLIGKNKKSMQEIERLLQDLDDLKKLMQNALLIEAQLKNVLTESSDLLSSKNNRNKILQLVDDDEEFD